MIFALDFLFLLYYVLIKEKKNLSVLGIHKQKWKVSLLINVVLALALLVVFLCKSTEPIHFTAERFFVGILYTTVFFLTENILVIFSFFWEVGAS